VTDPSVDLIEGKKYLRRDLVLEPELRRPIEQRALPCYLRVAACPHPDTSHKKSAQDGALARVGSKTPNPDAAALSRLRAYVCRYISKNLTPLSPDTDVSTMTWLRNSNYPLWRQEQLLEVKDRYVNIYEVVRGRHLLLDCKSFVKSETYPEWKHPRLINARHDRFKVETGPIFAAIEKQVFKDEWFIKKIPQMERPNYIKEHLAYPGAKLFATDFSQYEASFVAELMECVEFELYSYMVSKLPKGDEFMKLVRKAMLGENRCSFRDWLMKLKAKRMSGEMCTSLGNGFTNKMVIKFLCHERGAKVRGVVEGDDGLFAVAGACPTDADFARLGLTVKLEQHRDFSTASFCGLVFDEDDLVNVTDPRKVLATFGWTSRRYLKARHSTLMSLLKAKAMSVAHQYPGCPILGHMARAMLRLTASYDVTKVLRSETWWEKEKRKYFVGEAPFREPPINTRLLVERLYGISVEFQLEIERYFDNLQGVGPIEHEFIAYIMPEQWKEYVRWYSCSEVNERPTRGFPSGMYTEEWQPTQRVGGVLIPGHFVT